MISFHSLPVDDVFSSVGSESYGLTSQEVLARRIKSGLNILPVQDRVSYLRIFLQQFQSWFIYVLIIAAVLSFAFDKVLDAVIIFAIVILNAGIGFSQEVRAEKALAALGGLIVPRAKALRDGIVDVLDASELVPGDIIRLQAGDRVPADARIVSCRDFAAQESSLTGESFEVWKDVSVLPFETPLAERANMVWMGTLAATGSATAVVVAIGGGTAIGGIAQSIASTGREQTYFKKKTNYLALQLGIVAAFAAALISIVSYVRGLAPFEILLFSVASLVSSIPEGLPAVLAVVLAVGAYRMAQQKAIVRHLPVIEDLAAASIILTDKTGTLTQNTMAVRRIVTMQDEFEVTGSGWSPEGTFLFDQASIDPQSHPVLGLLTRIATLCNSASVHKEGGHYEIVGDPSEAAMVVLGEKAGLSKELFEEEAQIVDRLPFSHSTRFQSVLIKKPKPALFVSGGLESIFTRARRYESKTGARDLDELSRREFESKIRGLTDRAMRVIAFAYRDVEFSQSRISDGLVDDLVLVGAIGIYDPVRQEAPKALQDARRAGIRVIMVTGDHADTARAVAREVGLITGADETRVYTEKDLSVLPDSEFIRVVRSASVFARMTPEMKLKVIKIFQESGHVVAMIGDGVNDAPALKKANVGISMGTIGTDVAREASDIVLLDDNFSTLIKAIEQGRLIFQNIRKTSYFMITTSIAEIATIVCSVSIGGILPFSAIQILWINLITDGIPNIALAAERPHGDLLSRPPRRASERILSKQLAPYFFLTVPMMAVVTTVFFMAYLPHGVDRARTVAFALMVFFQLFNVLNMRSLDMSLAKIGLFSNRLVTAAIIASVLLQIAVMYIPFARHAFGLVRLSTIELTLIVLAALSIVVPVEVFKAVRMARERIRHPAARA